MRTRLAIAGALAGALSPSLARADGEPDGPPAAASRWSVAVPTRPGELGDAAADRPRVTRLRDGAPVGGALASKTIYLSAGHGWQAQDGVWRTQREPTHGMIEDLITIECVNDYLVPYLVAMGATVVTLREGDDNPVAVVVDDDAAALVGNVAELAGEVGWAAPGVLDATTRPFAAGRSRTIATAAAETGRAVFAASVPVAGAYDVYVSYRQGADRAPDAHYVVRHAGGETHFRVDQRRHGSTWVLLGRFWFAAGDGAAVAVVNDSAEGGVVSLDAVRLGGGMAAHDLGGGVLARPASELAARHHAQAAGAPPEVYDFFDGDVGDDVAARPRFAAWDHEDGEDAIYLAWHTNAPAPSRGSMTLTYGPRFPCCGEQDEFAGTPGSRELQDAVHAELLDALRTGWDPRWPDAGKRTASLGELRPAHDDEMPAILLEVAYHATPSDAYALRDPRFRRAAARGVARGIARYFAERDGRPLVVPPDAPTGLRLVNAGTGLALGFRAPLRGPRPTGYRVQTSRDGYGFDDGVPIGRSNEALCAAAPGEVRYVRVVASNEAGDSPPSEVVGARLAEDGRPAVLVVGGYDRLDRDQALREPIGDQLIDRVVDARINDGSYAARHGRALAAAGYAFDGATDEAIELGAVDLAGYRGVDWFVGAETVPLGPAARAALEDYLRGGGALVLSGSQLVAALDLAGGNARAFARDVLGVRFAGESDARAVRGELGAGTLASEGPGTYRVAGPDVLAPVGDARVALRYEGGAATAALVRTGGPGGAVVFGFPLELVDGDAAGALLGAAFGALGVAPGDEAVPTDGPTGLGGCAASSGGAGAAGAAAALVLALALVRRRATASVRRP